MTTGTGRTPGSGYEALSSTLVASDTLELQAQGEDLDAVVRLLPLQGARRVLDVGCGTGALTRTIARQAGADVEVRGLDLTPDHVDTARARAAAGGFTNLHYAVGDVLSGSAASGRGFDVVCEKYVLMTMLPRSVGGAFVTSLKEKAAPGGAIALIEADINFGQDRHPPAPEPLASVLARIVEFYRARDLIEWRCGLRIFEYLREAGLIDIRVRVADGRVIQGGTPRALVGHANTDVEPLIAPCLEDLGMPQRLDEVAGQWREYLTNESHFTYNPIFVGTGRIPYA
jgi:2-polyprenyl-3-methyl-5-hydroxy-6-metoxy-1,4-benzoquinol methylase